MPLADVRILVLAKDKDGNFPIAADVSHAIGVTNPFWASCWRSPPCWRLSAVLSLVSHRRLKRLGYDDLDPIIRIIATPDGYASLSQLQMVLWTFVVAASAVYVMVLSGELIQITTGTLVLLGISGAVTVGTALHDSAQSASAPRPRRGRAAQAALVRPRRQRDRRAARRSTSRACRCCISR